MKQIPLEAQRKAEELLSLKRANPDYGISARELWGVIAEMLGEELFNQTKGE